MKNLLSWTGNLLILIFILHKSKFSLHLIWEAQQWTTNQEKQNRRGEKGKVLGDDPAKGEKTLRWGSVQWEGCPQRNTWQLTLNGGDIFLTKTTKTVAFPFGVVTWYYNNCISLFCIKYFFLLLFRYFLMIKACVHLCMGVCIQMPVCMQYSHMSMERCSCTWVPRPDEEPRCAALLLSVLLF